MATTVSEPTVLTSKALLGHWQAHRRLTRRTIEAFPEDKLFSYSVGAMRPFSEMVMEFLKMGGPVVQGVATGQWVERNELAAAQTKAELLALWDEATASINTLWPTIPSHRFAEVDTAFGKWKSPGIDMILYAIDNEIHHRGQGYVYLRSLGIDPPAFYDRS